VIHSETVTDVYSKQNIPLWLISAFKAGFINSAGFLITGKFVSHVTGFGTQVGIATGHEGYFFGAELLIIPISFISGGVLTSYILDKNYEAHETPPYWKVQTLITGLLIFIIALGEAYLVNQKIPFDVDENYNIIEFTVISVLCLICGLKNGLVTWSTFGKIRVTHLTGLSTDIGLNLIRTFSKSQPSPRFKEERFINVLRIMTFLCFSVGAFISAILFPVVGFKLFFIPLVISILMSGLSIWDCRKRAVNKGFGDLKVF
jgi:uncharacterized membrane protein YoaK (UPF0700 family)